MHEFIVFLMVLAAGYVASGVIMSFYLLVTGKSEYAPQPKTDFQRVATVGLTVFTGPSLLATNALKADQSQPKGYAWIMFGITLFWSYLLGLFVVTIALSLPSPF